MSEFVLWLHTWPPEAVLVAMAVVAFGGLLALYRWFGPAGLFAFIPIAVIGANVQVLKVVQFSVLPDPVALGTVLFSATYLATDILSENHGPAAARSAVMIGFASLLLWVLIVVGTLGYAPLTQAQAAASDAAWALPVQGWMEGLFTPVPALFLAGMTAYLASQLADVWLFDLIRRRTGGRLLWLRNNLSTALSVLLDNTIFSVLAWIVLAETPLPWQSVVVTYILGTYALRLIILLADTPILYAARHLYRSRSNAAASGWPADASWSASSRS